MRVVSTDEASNLFRAMATRAANWQQQSSENSQWSSTPLHARPTFVMWDSSCRMIWVFLAIRALNWVGRARASSNELVWRLWVPPNMAAIASTHVRTMLLYGSWKWGKRVASKIFRNPEGSIERERNYYADNSTTIFAQIQNEWWWADCPWQSLNFTDVTDLCSVKSIMYVLDLFGEGPSGGLRMATKSHWFGTLGSKLVLHQMSPQPASCSHLGYLL